MHNEQNIHHQQKLLCSHETQVLRELVESDFGEGEVNWVAAQVHKQLIQFGLIRHETKTRQTPLELT